MKIVFVVESANKKDINVHMKVKKESLLLPKFRL